MQMKIYTKKGDQGFTRLISGTKVLKSHKTIVAYGSVDELNSWIGVLAASLPEMENMFYNIQDNLFSIGAILSCDCTQTLKKLPRINENGIKELENSIDEMNQDLPPLKHFIFPRGNQLSSYCHVARTVCRRSETECVELINIGLLMDFGIIKYINRLSDWLFTLARKIAFDHGIEEIIWKPKTAKKK